MIAIDREWSKVFLEQILCALRSLWPTSQLSGNQNFKKRGTSTLFRTSKNVLILIN